MEEVFIMENLKFPTEDQVLNQPHAKVIREQIKGLNLRLNITVEDANDYLEGLKVIKCGAIHEQIQNDPAVECSIRDCNIACMHALDFRKRDEDDIYPLMGVEIFGIKFFVIAYFLFQNGYTDLKWFIEKDLFNNILNDNYFKYDNWPENFFHNPAGEYYSKDNPKTKKHQRKIGKIMSKDYLDPTKLAMRDYMNKNLLG